WWCWAPSSSPWRFESPDQPPALYLTGSINFQGTAVRMRFSMKTEYGVRAIVELAANVGRGSLQSSEIARRQGIPGPFLDQVLMTLRRAGLVNSMRGPRGGHQLARRPDDVRLDEVIACLEGNNREARHSDGAPAGDAR